MKSFMASPSTIERKWYVVDATGHTLGRLASEVAKVLRGKNKPIFTPHMDTGDYVIIVNADKISSLPYISGREDAARLYHLAGNGSASCGDRAFSGLLPERRGIFRLSRAAGGNRHRSYFSAP